jgi:uncharacterized OB-fold protein
MNSVKIWRQAKKNYQYLGKKGKIISCTRVNNAPEDYSPWVPYWAGLVDIGKGQRVAVQMVLETQSLKVGDRVIGVLRRLKPPKKGEIIEYGVKYKVIKSN